MMDPCNPLTAQNLADVLLDTLFKRLPKDWRRTLSNNDLLVVRGAVRDAAELQVLAMMTPHTPEAQQKLLMEKRWIDAQLANLTAAKSVKAADVLWDVVQDAVRTAAAVAFTML